MNTHDDDNSIPSLPQYPIDPNLTDTAVGTSTSAAASTSTTLPQQQQQHDLDVEAEAALAADFFANADDTVDLSLGDASLGQDDSQLHQHQHQQDEHHVLDIPQIGGEVPLMPGEQDIPTYQPKKKKLQLACQFCRRRKLKCDGIKPACDNCLKRNENCVWDETIRRRGPGKRNKALRDRAAEDSSALSLHDAEVAAAAAAVHAADSSSFAGGLELGHVQDAEDAAAAVADTNAALIAAVTAAAAEGVQVGDIDESFGAEHLSGIDVHDYHTHAQHAPSTGTSPSDANILQQAQQGQTSGQRPVDPNIDPSLSDLAPSTLAELAGGGGVGGSGGGGGGVSPAPVPATSLQSQSSRPPSTQPHQPQQRKAPGIGVGVGVGVGVIHQPRFTITPVSFPPRAAPGSASAQAAATGPEGEGSGADATLDGIDWEKGYNFSTWPDLDLEPK